MLKNESPQILEKLKKRYSELWKSAKGNAILFMGFFTPQGKLNAFGEAQKIHLKKAKK